MENALFLVTDNRALGVGGGLLPNALGLPNKFANFGEVGSHVDSGAFQPVAVAENPKTTMDWYKAKGLGFKVTLKGESEEIAELNSLLEKYAHLISDVAVSSPDGEFSVLGWGSLFVRMEGNTLILPKALGGYHADLVPGARKYDDDYMTVDMDAEQGSAQIYVKHLDQNFYFKGIVLG